MGIMLSNTQDRWCIRYSALTSVAVQVAMHPTKATAQSAATIMVERFMAAVVK